MMESNCGETTKARADFTDWMSYESILTVTNNLRTMIPEEYLYRAYTPPSCCAHTHTHTKLSSFSPGPAEPVDNSVL